MEELAPKVRHRLEPAYELLMSYLGLAAEKANLGALVVWFDGRAHPVPSFKLHSSGEKGRELTSQVFDSQLGPKRISKFCSMFHRHPEGERRCDQCDKYWINRARRTGQTWTYQCHAGLTEVVVPVRVHEQCVAEIMGGQLVDPNTLPNGFEQVWERVHDLADLDRDELQRAFGNLHVVGPQEIALLKATLERAASALGALLENVADLVMQERQLAQVRTYQEREFVEFLIASPLLSDDEVLSRAQALGLAQPPTTAVVVQVDFTDRTTFEMDRYDRSHAFARLLEAVHDVVSDIPGAVVSSVRPGELAILLRPAKARNPAVTAVRLRELAQRMKLETEARAGVPIRIGVGPEVDSPKNIAESYREARAAAGYSDSSYSPRQTGEEDMLPSDIGASLLKTADTMRGIVRRGDTRRLQEALEEQLRALARYPEQSHEIQRLLFTHLLTGLIAALKEEGGQPDKMQALLADYLRSYPTLRSFEDILTWFHSKVGIIISEFSDKRMSPYSQIVADAREIVKARMHEAMDRAEVAEELGMSTTYFGKVFRKQTGITFREFLKRSRIAQAQRMLLDGDKSIATIAYEVGYSSPGAFARAFEEMCGVSPRAYRKDPSATALVSEVRE